MTSDIAITVEEVAAGHHHDHNDRYIGQTDALEYVWKCSKCNEVLAGRFLFTASNCTIHQSHENFAHSFHLELFLSHLTG